MWPWQTAKLLKELMATLQAYKDLIAAGFANIAAEQREVGQKIAELKARIEELIAQPPADLGEAFLELQGLVEAISTVYDADAATEPTPEPELDPEPESAPEPTLPG
jgi:hypothetical protein